VIKDFYFCLSSSKRIRECIKYAAAIGVDIGRYSLKLAVLNIDGDVLSEESFPLKLKQDKDYIISSLKVAIQNIRQKVAASGINPICIGIAAKGFVDHQAGIVLGPEHGIAGWKNVPLPRHLTMKQVFLFS